MPPSSIHSIRIPFQIPVAPDRRIDRFVHVYWIDRSTIFLIDAAVAGSRNTILDSIRKANRKPSDMTLLLLTHSHPDHVGGAQSLQKKTHCSIAAHSLDIPWIENVDRQFQERPVPGFHTLVEGSVRVDRVLGDGDIVDIDDTSHLRVLHTPGHSPGHLSFLFEEEAALFSGDAIPLPGEMPIYEDVTATLRSLRRLRDLPDVGVLYSSWDDPREGDAVARALDDGIRWIQQVHDAVREAASSIPRGDLRTMAARVIQVLSLPPFALNPLFMKTVAAHLPLVEISNLIGD